MTQFGCFQAWLTYFRSQGSDRQRALAALSQIVADAQNSPPGGGSDGSFSRESWTMARDIVRETYLLERAQQNVVEMMDRFARGEWPELPRKLDSVLPADDDIPF